MWACTHPDLPPPQSQVHDTLAVLQERCRALRLNGGGTLTLSRLRAPKPLQIRKVRWRGEGGVLVGWGALEGDCRFETELLHIRTHARTRRPTCMAACDGSVIDTHRIYTAMLMLMAPTCVPPCLSRSQTFQPAGSAAASSASAWDPTRKHTGTQGWRGVGWAGWELPASGPMRVLKARLSR